MMRNAEVFETMRPLVAKYFYHLNYVKFLMLPLASTLALKLKSEQPQNSSKTTLIVLTCPKDTIHEDIKPITCYLTMASHGAAATL